MDGATEPVSGSACVAPPLEVAPDPVAIGLAPEGVVLELFVACDPVGEVRPLPAWGAGVEEPPILPLLSGKRSAPP